ncbi:MAG TPA: nucleotidyl transferase AbiEii/AbiGii toxin family protein [Ignavibacteria bacterium]|nr:nucleotidyl transferase AbiEii/AbiGii toxin family protein [Ignavibacteria bacterium]
MHQAIKDLLGKYNLKSTVDYENALKEIIQQATLAGLWRAGFFNHSAFYGGTALRIFYGLQRFSEDLDFTLLKPQSEFNFNKDFVAIEEELSSLGFSVEISEKKKSIESNIESAFIKADTVINIIQVGAPADIVNLIPKGKFIKVKFEVDLNPPGTFETENKFLLEPIPCSIKLISPSYLFAGKMHAMLFRKWKNRVKGRDWYDFAWFVRMGIPLELKHLYSRMVQSQKYDKRNKFRREDLMELFTFAINNLDVEKAKRDVLPFIKNSNELDIWSQDYFKQLFEKMIIN